MESASEMRVASLTRGIGSCASCEVPGSVVSATDVLRGPPCSGHPAWVDEEQGIYRDEVMDIIGGLADISSDTLQILAILRGEDEEDEDAEEEPVDS